MTFHTIEFDFFFIKQSYGLFLTEKDIREMLSV